RADSAERRRPDLHLHGWSDRSRKSVRRGIWQGTADRNSVCQGGTAGKGDHSRLSYGRQKVHRWNGAARRHYRIRAESAQGELMRRWVLPVGGLLLLALLFVALWIRHRAIRYDHLIAQTAARHGLDFYLVKALIYEESWFRLG